MAQVELNETRCLLIQVQESSVKCKKSFLSSWTASTSCHPDSAPSRTQKRSFLRKTTADSGKPHAYWTFHATKGITLHHPTNTIHLPLCPGSSVLSSDLCTPEGSSHISPCPMGHPASHQAKYLHLTLQHLTLFKISTGYHTLDLTALDTWSSLQEGTEDTTS